MKCFRLAAASILAAWLVGACSNSTAKKKPIGNDAAIGDGSTEGGSGAGGAEAGLDAMPDVNEAAPDVTADAVPDVNDAMPDVNDAAADVTTDASDAALCGAGTVNLVAGGCIACPVDGGTAEAGAADAGLDGGDPYSPYLTCPMLAGATTSYDPSTHVLTIKADYPLQLDTVDYNIDLVLMNPSTGGNTFPTITGSLPLVGNTLTLDLSSAIGSGLTLLDFTIQELDAHDACGRVSSYVHSDCQNQPQEITFGSDGGVWTAGCGPNC